MKPLFIGIPIAAFFAWLLGGTVVPEPKEEDKQEEKKVEWQAPANDNAVDDKGLFNFSDFSWKPGF